MSGAVLSHVSLPPASWSRTHTRSSPAPIFRLPYELLTEILLIGRDNSERVERFLLAITSTCSIWRSAALITPSLWAVIRRPNFKKIEYEVEYLETVLERSMDSSLDIELGRDPQVPRFPAKIVKTIYPHLARCRRLCLLLTETISEIFPLPGPLERLTTLIIIDPGLGFWFSRPMIPDITFAQTPRLRDLAFRGFFSALRNLHCGSLTAIRLSVDPKSSALDFISRCPLAEHVAVSNVRYAPINREPVILNCLKWLAIRSDPSMSFRHFVKAPKVQELYLEGMHPYDIDELTRSIPPDVLLPPFQNLMTLSLADMELRCPGLYDTVVSHPRIEHLLLNSCYNTLVIPALLLLGDTGDKTYYYQLEGMNVPDHHNPLLPHLQRLVLRGAHSSNKLLGRYLTALLESRPTLELVATEDFLFWDVGFEALQKQIGNRCRISTSNPFTYMHERPRRDVAGNQISNIIYGLANYTGASVV